MSRFCDIVCVCIVWGHYVIAHVVYVLLCSAHGSWVSVVVLWVCVFCFLFIVCFIFVVDFFLFLFLLLSLLHFLCRGFVALCVCVVLGHCVLAHVVCVRSCRAHDSWVWLCCEFVFFLFYLLFVYFCFSIFFVILFLHFLCQNLWYPYVCCARTLYARARCMCALV